MKNKSILAVIILLLVAIHLIPLLPPKVELPATDDVQDASIQNAETLYRNASYADALKYYYVLASEGDSFSQYMTGHMYFYGEGTDKNVCEATYWYDKSARSGYGFAQFEMARAYYEGYGVERNNTKAYLWNRESLEKLEELNVKSRIMKIAKNQFEDIQEALKESKQLEQAANQFGSWQYQKEEPVAIIRLRKIPVFDLFLRKLYNTLPCDY
jgi:TPR repeat protein